MEHVQRKIDWDNDPVDHDGTDGFENYDKDEL